MDKFLGRLKIWRGASTTNSQAPSQGLSEASVPFTTTKASCAEDDENAGLQTENMAAIKTTKSLCDAFDASEASSFTKSNKGIDGEKQAQVIVCKVDGTTQTELKPSTDKESNRAPAVIATTSSSSPLLSEESELAGEHFSKRDLKPFCQQLRRLLDYVNSSIELNNIIYQYPSDQQKLLEAQAKELHSLYLEVQDAKMSVLQVKSQRKAVRKECNNVMKILTKIKDEEIKEMETFISQYDKTLLAKWEKIRNSTQEDMVESFLHDIQGKQQALSHLKTLAMNKLGQLKSCSKLKPSEDPKPTSIAPRRLSASGRNGGARWRSKHNDKIMPMQSSSSSQEAPNLPLMPVAAAPLSLILGTAQATNSSRSSSSSMHSSTAHYSPQHRSLLQGLISNIQHLGTHDNLPINTVMPDLIATTSQALSNHERENRSLHGQDVDSESEYQEIELHPLSDQS